MIGTGGSKSLFGILFVLVLNPGSVQDHVRL